MVEETIAASSESVSRSEHEGAVDLEPVERKFLEIAQARIAGAEIVEHEADAELLDAQEGIEHPLLVEQQDVLGHFQLEQRRRQPGRFEHLGDGLWRDRRTAIATATG